MFKVSFQVDIPESIKLGCKPFFVLIFVFYEMCWKYPWQPREGQGCMTLATPPPLYLSLYIPVDSTSRVVDFLLFLSEFVKVGLWPNHLCFIFSSCAPTTCFQGWQELVILYEYLLCKFVEIYADSFIKGGEKAINFLNLLIFGLNLWFNVIFL